MNLNEKDDEEGTALSRAINYNYGNTALIKFLINREGIEIDQQDEVLREALCLVVFLNKTEVMQLMIGIGKIDELLKDGFFDKLPEQWGKIRPCTLKLFQDAGYVPSN